MPAGSRYCRRRACLAELSQLQYRDHTIRKNSIIRHLLTEKSALKPGRGGSPAKKLATCGINQKRAGVYSSVLGNTKMRTQFNSAGCAIVCPNVFRRTRILARGGIR